MDVTLTDVLDRSSADAGAVRGPAWRPVPGPLEQRSRLLLAAASQGDHRAFAELFDLTSPRVFGVVVRVLRNHALAEEVTQEVFLEIWQCSARYDAARGSASGWMTTIAHRRAVDRVRNTESSCRRDTFHFTSGYAPALDATAESACRNLDVERVRDAMLSLTELQRGAVELAFRGGYSHREVAVLLEVPVGTAKARIRDGLIRLRSALTAA